MIHTSAEVQRHIYALMVLMTAADDRLSRGITGTGYDTGVEIGVITS